MGETAVMGKCEINLANRSINPEETRSQFADSDVDRGRTLNPILKLYD
jgi:hypothetical protein